jgi:tetratricopeptide (TPR) repeat protein
MRLDERGGDDTIAHHFERARPACSASDAAQRLRRAGQEAAHQMDFARAVDFHRAALAMLAEEEEGNGREAAEIGLEIGQAQCDHGDAEAGRASFVSVAERARARGLHDIFAAAAVRHATTLGLGSAPGDNAAAAALLEAACSRADDLTPALYGRVVALRNEMDPRSAPARTRRLVERARTSGDWRRAAALLEHLWWYCVGEARLEVAEELVAAGETGGDPRAEALGRIRRWTTLIHLGRAGFADPEAERIADLVDTVHDAELQWTWTYWRATVATMVGDLDAAERLIAQTLRIPGLTTSASSPLISRTKVLSFHQVQADQLAVLRGQPADFRARLSVPPTWGWRRLDVRPLGVWPLLAAGRIPEAHALLDPLVTEFPWSEQPNLDWLISLALLAQGCAASGYQRGAARAHAALDPHRGLFLVQGANSLGPVDHYAGLVEKALGDLDAAIDSQRAAVAHSRRAHASVYEVICGAQLARLLHRRGGPGDDLDSEQAAVTAAALADRCGMPRRKRPEAPQGVRIAAPAG